MNSSPGSPTVDVLSWSGSTMLDYSDDGLLYQFQLRLDLPVADRQQAQQISREWTGENPLGMADFLNSVGGKVDGVPALVTAWYGDNSSGIPALGEWSLGLEERSGAQWFVVLRATIDLYVEDAAESAARNPNNETLLLPPNGMALFSALVQPLSPNPMPIENAKEAISGWAANDLAGYPRVPAIMSVIPFALNPTGGRLTWDGIPMLTRSSSGSAYQFQLHLDLPLTDQQQAHDFSSAWTGRVNSRAADLLNSVGGIVEQVSALVTAWYGDNSSGAPALGEWSLGLEERSGASGAEWFVVLRTFIDLSEVPAGPSVNNIMDSPAGSALFSALVQPVAPSPFMLPKAAMEDISGWTASDPADYPCVPEIVQAIPS